MDTRQYKTKTILQTRQNPMVNGVWGIAIDIGYSAVKIYAPNTIASFPAYTRKVEMGTTDTAIGYLEKSNIAYRDESGEYFVGKNAEELVRTGEADSSNANIGVRDRYYSKEFQVISRCGLAMGMMRNSYGNPEGKELYITTGLPTEYIKTDVPLIKEVLSGKHKFSMKIGNNSWMDFEFTLEEDHISVIPQPMGTLMSICYDENGKQTPDAKKYLAANSLIFDPGFGTLDTFSIKNQYPSSSKTWSDLGMLRVLQEAAKIVEKDYNTQISIPAMQKVLAEGVFKTKFDHKTKSIRQVEFGDILEKASKMVCEEALNTLDGYYNYFQDEDYLIVTGGTGAAWYDWIKEHYKNFSTLTILRSEAPDSNVPIIFSNVKGYYMMQLKSLKESMKDRK